MENEYYKAYDERYKQVHGKNMLWATLKNTKEVIDAIRKYNISKTDKILDLGCGEGRDASFLLNEGFNVTAIDYSSEAIKKCNELTNNKYQNNFKALDIFEDHLDDKFRFIYSIAVLHMFVLDVHRNKFLEFIYNHLEDDGIALICVMGDGKEEFQTDINTSFNNTKRKILHNNQTIEVATTSCRIVNMDTFQKELTNNGFLIKKIWIAEDIPEFNKSICAIINKQSKLK